MGGYLYYIGNIQIWKTWFDSFSRECTICGINAAKDLYKRLLMREQDFLSVHSSNMYKFYRFHLIFKWKISICHFVGRWKSELYLIFVSERFSILSRSASLTSEIRKLKPVYRVLLIARWQLKLKFKLKCLHPVHVAERITLLYVL